MKVPTDFICQLASICLFLKVVSRTLFKKNTALLLLINESAYSKLGLSTLSLGTEFVVGHRPCQDVPHCDVAAALRDTCHLYSGTCAISTRLLGFVC